MQIREAVPEDAGAVIEFLERLYGETSFLLYEPGEMVPTPENYADRIREARRTQGGIMYLAHDDSRLVGTLFGNRGRARRNRHDLFLVLGVLKSSWNRGIGPSLLEAAENWSKSNGLHRLELTVQKRNTRAVALYPKAGFKVEGTKRDSLIVEDEYIDEWFMAKLIDSQQHVAAEHPKAGAG